MQSFINFLDNITGFGKKDWTKPYMITWFVGGVMALLLGFLLATDKTLQDVFMLIVSVIGLLCVLGLSFRKNIMGNGLGIIATMGESTVQAMHNATGLMLAPIFNFFTHIYGILYWQQNKNKDGKMIPKSATVFVWGLTALFVVAGLLLFPSLNNWLIAQNYGIFEDDGSTFFGLSFYHINIIAFVLSVSAQITMILRYSINWWLWILVNLVWLVVNIISGNVIFAIQTCIYQINAMIGLYIWHKSERQTSQPTINNKKTLRQGRLRGKTKQFFLNGAADGARTRDPRRDRPVF